MVAESGVVAVIASVGAFGMGFVASAGAVRAREKSRAAARRRASLSGEGLAGSRGGKGISDGVVSFVEARSRVAQKRSARPVAQRREEALVQVIRRAWPRRRRLQGFSTRGFVWRSSQPPQVLFSGARFPSNLLFCLR